MERFFSAVGFPPSGEYVLPEFSFDSSYMEASRYWLPTTVSVDLRAFEKAVTAVSSFYRSAIGEATSVDVPDVLPFLNLDASPGWPYTSKWATKRETIVDPQFWSDYFSFVSPSSRIPAFYCNAQKFELRKKGKPARTFMVGNILLHLASATLYWQQLQKIPQLYKQSYWWIGIGYSDRYRDRQWLWDSLHSRGANTFFATDVSGWDRSLSPLLLQAAMKVMRNAASFSASEALLADKLDSLLLYSPVIMDAGHVFIKHRGMPSGDLRTIALNSIANWIKNLYTFLVMVPPVFRGPHVEMDWTARIMEDIVCMVMGDDDVGSFSTEAFPWFSPQKAQSLILGLGLTLKVFQTSPSLEGIEFLSATFGRKDGVIVPYPNVSKLVSQAIYGAHRRSVRLQYIRLLSLRQNSWPNDRLFTAFNQVISLYWASHKEELMDRSSDLNIDVAEIFSQNVPESYIREIFVGRCEAAALIY